MTTSRAPDDLTQINGIGSARARALTKMGIRGFRDLAKSDPNVLAGTLRGVSAVIAREWVTEAGGRAVGTRARTRSASPTAAPAPAPARTHRTFTIDVQRETASGKIVGAVVTDTVSGDNLPTPLDGDKIMGFISERLASDVTPAPGGPASNPSGSVGILHTASIPELILEAPYGLDVAAVLPPGDGEARLWVSQRPLSANPATTAGHVDCALDPTSSVSTTVRCAPMQRMTGPYRLEFVADLRFASGTGAIVADGPAISVALLPDPSVLTMSAPVDDDLILDYWRQRSLGR